MNDENTNYDRDEEREHPTASRPGAGPDEERNSQERLTQSANARLVFDETAEKKVSEHEQSHGDCDIKPVCIGTPHQ
jgi:hypothetical protein